MIVCAQHSFRGQLSIYRFGVGGETALAQFATVNHVDDIDVDPWLHRSMPALAHDNLGAIGSQLQWPLGHTTEPSIGFDPPLPRQRNAWHP